MSEGQSGYGRNAVFFRALLLLYGVHLVAAVWTERALWLDGAYYFTRLLETQGFVLGDSSRAGADVLVEIPVVAALRAGITNLPLLKVLFGLPPFLLTPVCLVLCVWIAGPRPELVTWPLATIAAGLLNTELLVIHESRAAVALFWPALFALVDPLRRTSTLIVGLLVSLPLIASYESAIALGPILILTAFRRMGQDPSIPNRRLLWAIVTCAVFATFVAAASILRPTHPANLTSFQGSWRVILEPESVSLQLSLFVVGAAALGALLPRAAAPWFTLIASVAIALGVLQALSDPMGIAVTAQYRARIVNVVLPVVAAAPVVMGGLRVETMTMMRRVFGLLFAAQIVFQLQLTSQWHAFRNLARERTSCVSGLVPVDVALASGLQELRISPQWMHGWQHPTVSLLDRAGPVRGLIGRARGYTEWQPYDPLDPLALPDLARYGVDTSLYKEALARRRSEGGAAFEPLPECRNAAWMVGR